MKTIVNNMPTIISYELNHEGAGFFVNCTKNRNLFVQYEINNFTKKLEVCFDYEYNSLGYFSDSELEEIEKEFGRRKYTKLFKIVDGVIRCK